MNVEDRLTKLESESRCWRRIALALAIVIGASLNCSRGTQTPSTRSAVADASKSGVTLDEIRARRLVIVNDKDETVAGLHSYASGAMLHLDATGGHRRVETRTPQPGACLAVLIPP